MACRGGLQGGVVAILALSLGGSAEAAVPMLCLSGPGEPIPLPQVNDPDPVRARWAVLRAAELAREAGLAEKTARVASQRLWTRVLCLDAAHPGAREGLERTRSVRVHRPDLRWGTVRTAQVEDPWVALSDPVVVQRAPAPPAPEAPSLVRAREQIAAAEESLAAARFSEALGRAMAAREELATGPADATSRALRVQTEVIAATAQVALGDEDGARASFAEALAVDPELVLDPRVTSPKVLGVLEQARLAGPTP